MTHLHNWLIASALVISVTTMVIDYYNDETQPERVATMVGFKIQG